MGRLVSALELNNGQLNIMLKIKIKIKAPRQIKNFFPLDILKSFFGRKVNIPKRAYKTPKIIIPNEKAEALVKNEINPIIKHKIKNIIEKNFVTPGSFNSTSFFMVKLRLFLI